MQDMFSALMDLLRVPLRADRGVKTDNSILMIYPPDKELDFKEYLVDKFVPGLDAEKIPYRALDLTDFIFSILSEGDVAALQESEFEDYRWMQQGMSKRAEAGLEARLTSLAAEVSGGAILVYGTVALYPLVRFGEVLRGLRDLEARIVLAFPGEERGGRLHFMNQADGGNYLAVKLFWR